MVGNHSQAGFGCCCTAEISGALTILEQINFVGAVRPAIPPRCAQGLPVSTEATSSAFHHQQYGCTADTFRFQCNGRRLLPGYREGLTSGP